MCRNTSVTAFWCFILEGSTKLNLTAPSSLEEIEDQFKLNGILQNMKQGGYFHPTCQPNGSVAIIVPYKNRETQLKLFIRHMHPILQKQKLAYRVFIIEQNDTNPFNRAKLFNIGYHESITTYKKHSFTCFIFHDVDLLVETDNNSYACVTSPRYMCPAINVFGYRSFSPYSFGGVVGFSNHDFELVNGFSNKYWGWGSEDDDMYWRLHHSKKQVSRPTMEEGRYTMLSHKKQPSNGVASLMLQKTEKGDLDLKTNGLTSLKYKVNKRVHGALFTHLYVDLQMTAEEKKLTTLKST